MKIFLDTNVLISYLKDDRFASDTKNFLLEARRKRHKLLISDIVYSEIYTGIFLSENPDEEEETIQAFMSINNIEPHLVSTLEVAKRAGQLYARYLGRSRQVTARILPDYLIGAQAENYGDMLVTWNPGDYEQYLEMPVRNPRQALRQL